MKSLFILICVFLTAAAAHAQAENIVIYTFYNPPFISRNDAGVIDGIATHQVKRLMQETGLPYEIRMVSWTRAYRNALEMDNALIYSIVYTQERAEKFDWLAVLTKSDYSLYSRIGLQEPVSLKDIRAGKYTAVCPLQSVLCTKLEEFGFPEPTIYRISFMEYIEQYKLVAQGRVDFFVHSSLSYAYLSGLENSPYPKDTFKKIAGIASDYSTFFAAGKQVKPEIKETILKTVARLQTEGCFAPHTMETWRAALDAIAK